jgi:DnaK suppressor protein
LSNHLELNAEQLASLNQALDDLEQELLSLLSATESGAKPVKLKDNQGRLSRMDELHNQSILVANRNVAENRLKAVRRAKKRFAEDIYGYCDECDEPVAYQRLLAYPDASRCIECQSEVER